MYIDIGSITGLWRHSVTMLYRNRGTRCVAYEQMYYNRSRSCKNDCYVTIWKYYAFLLNCLSEFTGMFCHVVTLREDSRYTHATLTVRSRSQNTVYFPMFTSVSWWPYRVWGCEGYRGRCYWKRVKAVWPSGDWNVTVRTGSIRAWRWEDSCSVNWWGGLSVASVGTADSCVMLLLIV
jgi:hypothetical protein